MFFTWIFFIILILAITADYVYMENTVKIDPSWIKRITECREGEPINYDTAFGSHSYTSSALIIASFAYYTALLMLSLNLVEDNLDDKYVVHPEPTFGKICCFYVARYLINISFFVIPFAISLGI